MRRGTWARALLGEPLAVGSGCWALRGGLPRHGMNVFLIDEGDGVACFDTGSREMAGQLRRAAAARGGLTRVVLSHGHPDHRGAARPLGAPVWCHRDEVEDVEGDGGRHYWGHGDNARVIDRWRAQVMSRLRDAGPVSVSGTLGEGDNVGDFTVIDLPGHAPGQIGLWRQRDRTILAGDCFYAPTSGQAALPAASFNHHPSSAVASVRRIIDLQPEVAWAAHGPALIGDVSGALRRALGD